VIRWLLIALILLGASPPQGGVIEAESAPEVAPSETLLEKLRYNVRERTRSATADLDREEFESAADSLETAQRLAPDSPTALYNLGTGHLHALDPRAITELETLLEAAPPELVADAAYNLGNARFAANDFQGAIEAYKQTLRTESAYEDAKHNLELALQKLEEQQQQQQSNDSQSDSDSEGDQGDSGEQDSPPGEDQQEQDESSEGDQENEDQGNEPEADGSEGEDQRNPLPQFEEQPEMTAEQAAAILEAVDNLERRQRQEDAREKARPVPVGGKDW